MNESSGLLLPASGYLKNFLGEAAAADIQYWINLQKRMPLMLIAEEQKCANDKMHYLNHHLAPVTGGLGLLVDKGQPRNDQLLFLQPFDARLWTALLGTAFAAALVLKLLSLYTPLGDRQDPDPGCRIFLPGSSLHSMRAVMCVIAIPFHDSDGFCLCIGLCF